MSRRHPGVRVDHLPGDAVALNRAAPARRWHVDQPGQQVGYRRARAARPSKGLDVSRRTGQHRKLPRSAPARVRAGAHRKPSPIAAALQQTNPRLVAAAMTGSILVVAAGPAAAHWAASASHLGPGQALLNSLRASAYPNAQKESAGAPGAGPAGSPEAAAAGLAHPSATPSAPHPTPRGKHHRQAASPPAYRNPFRDVGNLLPERIDQGVDFGGSGPVYALGDAVVTNATASNYGWPGGGWITYQLADGPDKGMMVFLAEDVKPTVQVGQHVTSSTVIADMYDGGDGIETGWAMANGLTAESQTPEAGGISGNGPFPTAVGMNFEEMLQSLGVPPSPFNRDATPYGALPPNYPSWK